MTHYMTNIYYMSRHKFIFYLSHVSLIKTKFLFFLFFISHKYMYYVAILFCIRDKLEVQVTQLLTLVRFKDDNLEIKRTLLELVEVYNFWI